MSAMSYNEFIADVSIKYELQPRPRDQRYGQMYFNYLYEIRPDIADTIRGTVNDPFHRDNVPPNVHSLVEKMWVSG